MSIIDKITLLLEEKKLSQKDLTDYLNVDKSTFSQWKNGKSKSYTKYIQKIAKFLDTTVENLLNESPDDELSTDLRILHNAASEMTVERRKLLIKMAYILLTDHPNEPLDKLL